MLPKFIENSTSAKSLLRHYGITNPNENLIRELYSLFKEKSEQNKENLSINSSDLIFQDGNFIFQNNTKEIDNEILDVLNEFIQSEETKNTLDFDANGELSEEEMEEFLTTIQSLDNNEENVSIYDVFSAMDYISQGIYGTDEMLSVNEEILSDETPDEEINEPSNTNNSKNYSKNSSSNYNNSTSDNSGSYELQKEKKESIKELETRKNNEIIPALEKAQKDVQDVHSGNNQAIKSAQEDCQTKKEAYEEALKNDKNISNDLKEKQKLNQNNIDNKKASINEFNTSIYSKETQISQQESLITSDKSDIAAINKSIAELNSQIPKDEEHKAAINSKLQEANKRLKEAEDKLEQDNLALENYKNEKIALEKELAIEEKALAKLEQERQTIEQEIQANCGETTKIAMDEFKAAEANIETVKSAELEKAKNIETQAQNALNEINKQIDTLKAQEIEKEFALYSLKNPEQLYELMKLEEQGLNKEVFMKAIEGYNNLDNKGNGILGIFDTTQGADAERFYSIDLNTFELRGKTAIKIGSGNMNDCIGANKHGSKATLSGFERVGSSYKSGKSWELGIRLEGLEAGINDNSLSKSTVAHYTKGNYTWGCKGITPIYKNGKVDHEASKEKVRYFFPEGSTIWTCPTDEKYWEYSKLYQ